jgi:hypothetical protein
MEENVMEPVVLTPEEIEAHTAAIDKLSHLEMARLWRFAPSGHPYFNNRYPLFNYFAARFKSLGGMTPAISKQLGWR